jgi:hypothetical protein
MGTIDVIVLILNVFFPHPDSNFDHLTVLDPGFRISKVADPGYFTPRIHIISSRIQGKKAPDPDPKRH